MDITPRTTAAQDVHRKSSNRLQDHADAIRALSRRMIVDVVEIGRRLTEVRRISGHGNFGHWLAHEFGWSPSTAKRFIQVFALAAKAPKLGDLNLPLAGVYLLAQDSTPDHVIEEVISRAGDGEVLPLKEIRALIPRKGGAKVKTKASSPDSGFDGDIVAEAYALVMRMTLHQRRVFVARLPGLVSLRDVTPSPVTPVAATNTTPAITNMNAQPINVSPTIHTASGKTYTADELKVRVAALNADVDPVTGIPMYLRRQPI